MAWFPAALLLTAQLAVHEAEAPPTALPSAPPAAAAPAPGGHGEVIHEGGYNGEWYGNEHGGRGGHCRGFLQSDHAFPDFVGPISNPFLSKDPRSLTEARFLYINNWVPNSNPVPIDDFQAYGIQLRIALTERLSFIADKDGYATFNTRPPLAGNTDGWLNTALGFKYVVLRDECCQRLITTGLQYEMPTGSQEIDQGRGAGVFTGFIAAGQEFGCTKIHLLSTVGYQFAANRNDNSDFVYASVHLDRQFWGCIYPLVEFNWFHYTGSGDVVPRAVGEGDGLINLGTQQVSGNDIVTGAAGMKIKFGCRAEVGAAYEIPLTDRRDLIQSRLLAELILRY